MKARSTLTSRIWLRRLAVVWVVCPALSLLGAYRTANADSQVKPDPSQTLHSAVQRELAALHAKDNQKPSQSSCRCASCVTKCEQACPTKTTCKTVSARKSKQPGLLSKLLPFTTRSAKSASQSSAAASRTPKLKPVIQQTAATFPASSSNGLRPKSAIEMELEKLYARDGRQMPPMRLSEMPMVRSGAVNPPARVAPTQRRDSKVVPVAARAKSLISRLLPFGRKKTTVARTPVSPRAIKKPAPIAAPVVTKTAVPPLPEPAMQVEAPEPLPLVKQSAPIKLEPKRIPDPVTESTDETLDNPFPAMSEAEADQDVSPKESLELTESTEKEDVAETTPTPDVESKFQKIHERTGLKGLKGFCVVALRDERTLRDAKPEFTSTYQSHTYQFSSMEAQAKFEKNPELYAPAKGGLDVIQLASGDDQSEGTLDHAAWYQGKLFLFANAENVAAFRQSPSDYAE